MSHNAPWEDLPKSIHESMAFLGCFRPTIDPKRKELKGWMIGGDGCTMKTSLRAGDLRVLADDFYKVADWLEDRALMNDAPTTTETKSP